MSIRHERGVAAAATAWILCATAIALACGLAFLCLAGQPESEFERRYKAWREYRSRPEVIKDSSMKFEDAREYWAIVSLGPQAVPDILAKVEAEGDVRLSYALGRISKKKFSMEARRRLGDAGVWLDWWRSGRARCRQDFGEALGRWRRARDARETLLTRRDAVYDAQACDVKQATTTTDLGKAYEDMLNLGIDILPFLMERLQKGDAELLPLFEELTSHAAWSRVAPPAERIARNVEWWEKNKEWWTIPEPTTVEAKEEGTKP